MVGFKRWCRLTGINEEHGLHRQQSMLRQCARSGLLIYARPMQIDTPTALDQKNQKIYPNARDK
jgi:hypothetical protein